MTIKVKAKKGFFLNKKEEKGFYKSETGVKTSKKGIRVMLKKKKRVCQKRSEKGICGAGASSESD